MQERTLAQIVDNFYLRGSDTAYVHRRGYRIQRWTYRQSADAVQHWTLPLQLILELMNLILHNLRLQFPRASYLSAENVTAQILKAKHLKFVIVAEYRSTGKLIAILHGSVLHQQAAPPLIMSRRLQSM